MRDIAHELVGIHLFVLAVGEGSQHRGGRSDGNGKGRGRDYERGASLSRGAGRDGACCSPREMSSRWP